MSALGAPSLALEEKQALIELRGLRKYFPVTKGTLFERTVGQIKAVDDVSFAVRRGETLGLVGESGCGKSTIGRCILKLDAPSAGAVFLDGRDIATFDRQETLAYRRRVQAVFQDPFSSLNPRMTVAEIVAEPLIVHEIERTRAALDGRVRELLDHCGLSARLADRYPHEMSGGQRQRVGIARALALRPDFILCDEAVSALDVSIQAQIIRLLEDLRDEFGLTYLFIGHDLSVVRHICHRVAVMYLGKLVEISESDALFDRPRHPYTQALLSAIPVPDPVTERAREHQVIAGEIPSPMNPPSGCVFHPRCPIGDETCRREVPELRELAIEHQAACLKVGREVAEPA
jgi:oligopeptide transport system ATP-binding protein